MGPTNVALVKLFQADLKLREAQERLDAATKNVRLQQRRVTDLQEKAKTLGQQLREAQARQGQLDLEIRTRDAQIERLRTQQQQARNNKEYQAFLVEINTHKVDRGKSEELGLKQLEVVEKLQKELNDLTTHLQGEQAKLTEQQGSIGEQTKQLHDEVEALKIPRAEAEQAVPPKARDAFNRLSDRLDGEAMSPLIRPNARLEEYTCESCQMDLVRDVYNKLHTRDEIVFCPSCGRMLYIPEDLPISAAVNKPKPPPKARPATTRTRAPKATVTSGAPADAVVNPRGGTWSEPEFMNRVRGTDKPNLPQNQARLLERLRSAGIDGVHVKFDGAGDVKASYNVYVGDFGRELLRVNYDGSYYVNWLGFIESERYDLVRVARAQFEPFMKRTTNDQGTHSADDRNLADVDPDQVAGAVFDVAKAATGGTPAAAENAVSPVPTSTEG